MVCIQQGETKEEWCLLCWQIYEALFIKFKQDIFAFWPSDNDDKLLKADDK